MIKIFHLLILALLFSCTNKSLDTEYDIVGKWELDELEIEFIHANITVAFNDLTKINSDLINPDFKIHLADDLTFKFENEDLSVDKGVYQYLTESLIIKKDDYDWHKFRIEKHTDQILILTIDRVMFYQIDKDSVEFFTGDGVKMKLKKSNF